MPDAMNTAIVILNYNGENMLRQYLPVLLENTEGAVVYVADNASTDNSVVMLTTEFPEVKQINLDKNYGFAEGYNRALKTVEADYFVLLNSDVKVTKNWLRPLETFLDSHPEVAACQPKLLAMDMPDHFEYAGASGGFLDKYGYPFCRGRIFDSIEKDEGQYDDCVEVMWATGAALMIRSSDWNHAGGLDGSFFAHNEEIDLCWRLRNAGRKIYIVPDSVVYHIGAATLSKSNPKKTFLNFRNNLLMLYKNLPAEDLKRVMAIRWFLDYLAAWQTLVLNHNFADFLAIYHARRAYKKMRRQIVRKQPNCYSSLTSYSILVKYYLKHKRKYSEL